MHSIQLKTARTGLLTAALALALGVTVAQAQTDTLQGHITTNKTLSVGTNYIIKGYTIVDSGFTLTINPGVTVKGQKSSKGTLAIAKGAKINALGTAVSPITFTSDEPDGAKTRGSWGGIVLLGRATTNLGSTSFEAITDWTYGGTNDADSSGVMQYVRIDHPGFPVAPDKELNGLTLGAVGNKTKISYVQVHNGDDDGFEFFGGTVSPDHLIVTNEVDDGFDSDNGFRGTVSYGIIIQGSDANRDRTYTIRNQANTADSIVSLPAEVVGDKLFESSSTKLAGGAAVLPQTNPTWSRITAIDNGKSGGGINLNEHAVGTFDRLLMIGDSSAYAVNLQSSGTNAGFLAGTPTVKFNKSWLGGIWKGVDSIKFQTNDAANALAIRALLTVSFKNTGMPVYKDLGLVNDSLRADSVGAIVGNDTAAYWYKGWSLPGTVTYAKGATRPTGIRDVEAARASSAPLFSAKVSGSRVFVTSLIGSYASVQIVDINGREILATKQALSQGENVVGQALPRGVYFLTVKSGDYSVHQKLNVLDR